mmetsp:Transcript_22886/g.64096  ORF Transcript_22886/g.64096 Transcript_22886/m.64096 type:complete len:417 (-) Transcript_22886:19-1269(-)
MRQPTLVAVARVDTAAAADCAPSVAPSVAPSDEPSLPTPSHSISLVTTSPSVSVSSPSVGTFSPSPSVSSPSVSSPAEQVATVEAMLDSKSASRSLGGGGGGLATAPAAARESAPPNANGGSPPPMRCNMLTPGRRTGADDTRGGGGGGTTCTADGTPRLLVRAKANPDLETLSTALGAGGTGGKLSDRRTSERRAATSCCCALSRASRCAATTACSCRMRSASRRLASSTPPRTADWTSSPPRRTRLPTPWLERPPPPRPAARVAAVARVEGASTGLEARSAASSAVSGVLAPAGSRYERTGTVADAGVGSAGTPAHGAPAGSLEKEKHEHELSPAPDAHAEEAVPSLRPANSETSVSVAAQAAGGAGAGARSSSSWTGGSHPGSGNCLRSCAEVGRRASATCRHSSSVPNSRRE